MIYTKDTISFASLPTNPKFINRTNQIFDRLTVLGYAGRRGHDQRWWCECICGTILQISGRHLISSHTRSCGCLHQEIRRQIFTTHGESVNKHVSPEFSSYLKAKARCQCITDHAFFSYGGRGIEFRFESFAQFLQELGRKPTPQHSINRINNNGHYEIGNVEWATPTKQNRNTRQNRLVTINDMTKCIAEWATMPGVMTKAHAMRQRIYQGWCDECAVTQPFYGHCSHRAV